MRESVKELCWWLGGVAFGGVLMWTAMYASKAESQTFTAEEIEELQKAHIQYLAATDEIISELNHCSSFILTSNAFAHLSGVQDPEVYTALENRGYAMGTLTTTFLKYTEYYFPHIYYLDASKEEMISITQDWVHEIMGNPEYYPKVIHPTWFQRCEALYENPEAHHQATILKKYPAVADVWPQFPGREPPPLGFVPPSIQRMIREKSNQDAHI